MHRAQNVENWQRLYFHQKNKVVQEHQNNPQQFALVSKVTNRILTLGLQTNNGRFSLVAQHNIPPKQKESMHWIGSDREEKSIPCMLSY